MNHVQNHEIVYLGLKKYQFKPFLNCLPAPNKPFALFLLHYLLILIFRLMYLAEVKCPYKKISDFGGSTCVQTFPVSRGPFPLQLHLIPPSLEEEGCGDEGMGGGGGGVRLLSSYQHQRQKHKAAPAVHISHCSK